MKIVLGVCAGVAAYKAAELTRELGRRGAEVQVVMTAGAERFIAPLTFAALSGRQVMTSLWSPVVGELAQDAPHAFNIEHIQAAQQPDAFVVAPATANVLAKMAHGLADDLLTTMLLATSAPVVVAPAMNVNMWRHPATTANIDILRRRGVHIVEPDSGPLACGMVGEGRLADILAIADAAHAAAHTGSSMAGETVLITAGGTREPIDAVRFLGNRSSGRMGVALAHAALQRGARVLFIHAAMDVAPPPGCEAIPVSTAAHMHRAVLHALPRASIVIMAAAVADFRAAEVAPQKLKKQDTLTLHLVRNDDILRAVVAARRDDTIVVGFAAETENLLAEARRKLLEKGVDAIVANDVARAGSGFEADTNAAILLTRDTELELPLMSKRSMAAEILNAIANLRDRATLASLI